MGLTLFDEKNKRTLTPAKKTALKDATGGKCQICGKREYHSVLCVHHIRSVSKSKYDSSPLWNDYKKPPYDRASNLLVLCPTCHRKIHAGLITGDKQRTIKAKGKTKRTATKKKTRRRSDEGLINWDFKY
jgi:hypothetical protein